MLGISAISSASGTANYFAKDNYYSKEQSEGSSQWMGEGSKELGLDGTVSDEKLLEVLNGKFGDVEFGKENHNPGRDFTFSMPKSASIVALVGGDKRVSDAYMSAVKEGIAYLEKHLVVTRQRNEEGKRISVKTGNAIMAAFPHDTSRAQDANAHIHVLVANGTKGQDGEYKAINFYPMYNVRYELNHIVQERFRNALHKLGYETINKDNGGHFEIVGVPQKVNEHFSKRSAQIKQLLGEINNPSWEQRQNAAYNTRPSKGNHDRPDLVERWRSEAKDLGFDAEKFAGSRDTPTKESLWTLIKSSLSSIFHTRHPNIDPDGIKLAGLSDITQYTISALSETKTTINRTELIAEVSAISQGGFSIDQINQEIEQQQKTGELVAFKTDKYAGNEFTTQSLIDAERSIIKSIEIGQNTGTLYAPTHEAINKVEMTTLTEGEKDGDQTGQKAAANEILFGGDFISGIQGYAGVGKTYLLSTVRQISQELNKEQRKSHEFVGLAPTIAAVGELKNKAGIKNSMTFQQFQHDFKRVAGGKAPTPLQLATYSGKTLLVDEGSMLSVKEVDSFIATAKKLKVTKIVMIGDVDQIQSLKAGQAFRLMQENDMKTAIVDQIFRQKNEVILEAVKFATQHDINASFEKIEPYITNHRDPMKEAARKYVDQLSSDIKSKIITPENKTIEQITAEVRRLKKERRLLDNKDVTLKTFKSLHLSNLDKKAIKNYKAGDSLVFHKTLAHNSFKAGEVYKITHIDEARQTMKLEGVNVAGTKTWKHNTEVKSYPFDVVKNGTQEFSKGDAVRFSLGDKHTGIKRHEAGTITSVSQKHVSITTAEGENKTVSTSSIAAKGLTHDYASTVFSSQGKDVKNVHLVMMGKAFSSTYENFYVGISRAVDFLHVYTDNKDQLRKTISKSAAGRDEHAIEHAEMSSRDNTNNQHQKSPQAKKSSLKVPAFEFKDLPDQARQRTERSR